VVAKGHVQISEDARTVLADTVTYNRNTDTVTASGHVSLLEPTGEILFADFVELDSRFENGFLQDIRLLLTDRSRLAANTGRRRAAEHTELRRGVYSPCDLCREDPTRPPTWQIRAEEIVHDKETQTVEYRNAVIEVGGVPILYTPYLAHPDPSVKRRSGFLPPSIGFGGNLGAHVALPYYWAIAPDRDATFGPLFTEDAGQAAVGEYRQRFSNGQLRLSGSINDGQRPEDVNQGTIRGHIFATGEWDLDPTWRTGFNLARSTDQTYLQRFHFGGSDNFLTSRIYAEAFRQRSFFGIDGYSFQPLRQGVGDSSQPIVLPVATYSWIGEPDIYGGRLNLDANFLDLNRSRGVGSHRLSLGTGWTRPFVGPIGDLYTLSLTTRGDAYYSTDLQLSPGERAQDPLAGRLFPQAGLQWRYPLIRRGENYAQKIEPIAAIFVGPRGGNPAKIPNEDSTAFDFDDTDLFIANRFPGLDRVDGGTRVDYGVHGTIYGDHGGSSDILVGQSRRLQQEGGFPVGSGVEDKLSDIVGHVGVSPSGYFDATYRFRLDKEDFRARRQELTFGGGPQNLRLSLSYVKLPPDFLGGDTNNRQQLTVGVSAGLSRYWSTALATTRNLTTDPGTVSSSIMTTYQDECLSFITTLSQSGVTNRDVKPGVSLIFTIAFKGLGEISAPAFSTTGQ
ncbi:MAG: LPS-assembly protein LptD, partial [Alphaproteobacteria bacterium]|nr:LPS-assembly protein LptD [Alphaproteobacteria bacterium]